MGIISKNMRDRWDEFDFVPKENQKQQPPMPDEYIRLDTTIVAIDNLINEAATGTMARTLFEAKDTIYNQQRYVIDVQPVKHGKWEQGKCTNCEKSLEDLFSGDFYWDDDELHFCPNCGARMIRDGETVLQDRCSNYCDCDGSCFIDDTPCDCAGNIEKCKGR